MLLLRSVMALANVLEMGDGVQAKALRQGCQSKCAISNEGALL
jgi:hypothetical protein